MIDGRSSGIEETITTRCGRRIRSKQWWKLTLSLIVSVFIQKIHFF